MRRSAAPSVRASKKPKFSHPFLHGNVKVTIRSSEIRTVCTSETSVPVTVPPTADQLTVLNNTETTAEDSSLYCQYSINRNSKLNISKSTSCKSTTKQAISKAFRSPLTIISPSLQLNGQGTSTSTTANVAEDDVYHYYTVMWCKMSKKKHKKWDGDGILVTKGRTAILKDLEGKEIGKGAGYKSSELQSMKDGHTLCIGGKEVEVMGRLTSEDYLSGKCFNQSSSCPQQSVHQQKPVFSKPFAIPQKTNGLSSSLPSGENKIASKSNTTFGPRHDVNAPNALVMPRPCSSHQWEQNKGNLPVVDVVVDPYISRHLRPHQREGVLFLYECVTGLRNFNGTGAILADDMGLGKTLQCIALIWTLHKQGMYGMQPPVKRTLVITPGSLVKNWRAEFRKWLGDERLKVYVVNSDKRVKEFEKSPVYRVIVINYEMFLRCVEDIKNVKFDLVVCDEAHRLKNNVIKTTTMISSLKTRRRILLTGTPIQNDLKEFHSLIELCNPGVLGTQASFRRIYEDPIIRSQQPEATPEEKLLGETRAAELNRLTRLFFLRRTADINNRYLPPKVETVVFCRPTELQLSLYRHLLASRVVQSCVNSYSVTGGARHLVCIAALKKLCNDPCLIHPEFLGQEEGTDNMDNDSEDSLYDGILPLYPHGYNSKDFTAQYSGKLTVLCSMLARMSQVGERVVLVSNYTKTLDVLQKLCQAERYQFLRLDGSTPTSKRQSLVDRFNSKTSRDFVFLLSSKAGGVGLNLIGASRLILFDIDWNPANDLQAMARIWRDGQKRKVYIYRMLTTGTIEEKIYQRQITKQGLSGAVADAKESNKVKFSLADLKDLFTLHTSSCLTHDLLSCDCTSSQDNHSAGPSVCAAELSTSGLYRSCQLGIAETVANPCKKNLSIAELMEWQHFSAPISDSELEDEVLKPSAGSAVSFVFQSETSGSLGDGDTNMAS